MLRRRGDDLLPVVERRRGVTVPPDWSAYPPRRRVVMQDTVGLGRRYRVMLCRRLMIARLLLLLL